MRVATASTDAASTHLTVKRCCKLAQMLLNSLQTNYSSRDCRSTVTHGQTPSSEWPCILSTTLLHDAACFCLAIAPAAREEALGDSIPPPISCWVASRATAAAFRKGPCLPPGAPPPAGVVGREACLLPPGEPRGDWTYWSNESAASSDRGELRRGWSARLAPVAAAPQLLPPRGLFCAPRSGCCGVCGRETLMVWVVTAGSVQVLTAPTPPAAWVRLAIVP